MLISVIYVSLTEFIGMDLEMAIDTDYHEGRLQRRYDEAYTSLMSSSFSH